MGLGKVVSYYRIADLNHPMYHDKTFDTFEEALEVLDREYTRRAKGDGHDQYWRQRNTGIEKVTTVIETLYSNKTGYSQSDET